MTKTTITKKEEITRDWHVIDARGRILGTVASEAAQLLIGKHKPTFVPHLNCGDKVIITNAAKVAVTGNKETQKIYSHYTGFPGGIKSENLKSLRARKPEDIIKKAIKGMLPKNKLQNERMKNLYIYAGDEHPHQNLVKGK